MAEKSDVIFACVKPNVILPALYEIRSELLGKLVISVAAGITLNQLQEVSASRQIFSLVYFHSSFKSMRFFRNADFSWSFFHHGTKRRDVNRKIGKPFSSTTQTLFG